MVNVSGRRGTAAETAVVNYLRAQGFPHAERRRLRGAEDWGDLTGTPGLCWEVKGGESARTALEAARGEDRLLTAWLAETERERLASRSDLGLLVVQRRGCTDAGRWFVLAEAADVVRLILAGPVGGERGRAELTPEPRHVAGEVVRVELRHVTRWLRLAGYGQALEAVA